MDIEILDNYGVRKIRALSHNAPQAIPSSMNVIWKN